MNDKPSGNGLGGQLELATKIGAGFLGFAYISGYLIVNTYLSSFGISGDAIQVFKSRYIYVGFFYVLLLSTVVLLFAVGKKLWDLFPVPQSDTRPLPDANAQKRKEKEFMLWVMVVAALVIPTNIELILFNSMTYKEHMIVQCGLLSSVVLYQLTYFWAYRDPEWDRDSYKIAKRRVFCFVLELLCVALLVCAPRLRWLAYWYGQHLTFQVVLFVVVTVASFWLLTPFFLTARERKIWEEKKGPVWTWGILKRSRFLVFVPPTIAGALIAITAVPYWRRWWLIQNADLLLAVFVLGGVILVSIQANKQRDRDALPKEVSTAERAVRWVLRITVGVTLYLITTLGYAYAFYNHIPLQKEGGDYTTSSVVRITLDGVSFEDMVILSQDSAYLYAARVYEWNPPGSDPAGVPGLAKKCSQDHQCGPKHWRDGLLEECGPFRPKVFAISQKSILTIQETGKVSEHVSCKGVLAK